MTTTTATATTKTQNTAEKQTTTQQQQPKTITITAQQAEQLAQQLGFKPIYKKAEAYIRHLEHVLRHIGREVRRRFLEELILKGEAELPALVVTGYRINWDALQTTLQQLLKETDLPEAVKKAMLERLRQLEEEIKEVPNTEELIKLIQKELGGLLEKPVINLASLYSSIASYLAEHGVSPDKIKQIIDEIQEKVFGKGVLYWMPSSPQEIEQKLKQLEQILAQNNIPIYETETKLVPLIIKNYVVKNPKELIEKVIEEKLKNADKTTKEILASNLYTVMTYLATKKGYKSLENIPLSEFATLLSEAIQQLAKGDVKIEVQNIENLPIETIVDLIVNSNEFKEFVKNWFIKKYYPWFYDKLITGSPEAERKFKEFFEKFKKAMRDALLVIFSRFKGATGYTFTHWLAGAAKIHSALEGVLSKYGIRIDDRDYSRLVVPVLGGSNLYYADFASIMWNFLSNFAKYLTGKGIRSVKDFLERINKLYFDTKVRQDVLNNIVNLLKTENYIISPSKLEAEILKIGEKANWLKPEKTVTYQMEISFKVPRFQSLITEELAAARHRAEEVLNRFYQEMHKIYSDLFRKVFRLIRVRLRII